MTELGLSAQIAECLCSLCVDNLPERTIEAAKDRLLHGIGVTLVSSQLGASSIAWRAVRSESGTCTVLGRSGQVSAGAAAFANAVAAHNSLQEDCGPGGLSEGSHPGTYVLPAALAAAEQIRASGRQVLQAIVSGYEAVGMLGELAPASIVARRFRPLGVLGPIGSAAAVATLWGASPSELAAALSIAANAASGYGQGFVAGSIEPYVHAGYAARNGLLAATLALAGGTASPNSFEGPYGFFQTYGGEAGRFPLPAEEHAITRLGTKKYAACLQNQESLELILEQLPVPIEGSIRTVRLYRPATPNNGVASPGVGTYPPYETMLQRQMSARFTAAAALLGRPVDDVRYFETAGSDGPVAQLAARIELVSTREATVRIEVETADGRTHSADGDMSAALFPASEEIRRRFRSRAESVIGAAAAEVEPLIAKLEQVPDVNELLILLRPQPREPIYADHRRLP